MSLESIYAAHRSRAEFFVVYIREAHPTDGWQIDGNVPLAEPRTQDERNSAATACRAALSLSMPILVDDMEDTANRAYAAWPERLYVIGVDGRIAYAGGPGPFEFRPAELRSFLDAHLADAPRQGEPGGR